MRSAFLHRLILSVIFSLSIHVFANENPSGGASSITYTGSIKGKVIVKDSAEPMAGVNILILNTNLGASSNQQGEFVITNVPVGEVRLVASFIGYKSGRIPVNVENNQTVTVEVNLEEGFLETGAIVVTGTSTPRLYEEAPVRTEVISRKLIERKQALNLAEALSLQTGVQVDNECNNCNFMQVRILGFDGKYSQILIDGDPVINSVAGVYGLEHFPEEMIDRIEIVKGGGSALYGGDAIAGTINMMTRRPYLNRIRAKYQGVSNDGTYDQQMGAMAEMVNDDLTSGAFLFASTRRRDPYDRNNDGFSELGLLRNESLGFNWFYEPMRNGEFNVNIHHIHEERRGGNAFDLPVHEAEIAEYVEHWRYGGTLRWQHRPSAVFDYRTYYAFGIIDRKSYFGGLSGDTPEERLQALDLYGNTDNALHIGGAQFNYHLGRHQITGGVQYTSDKLVDKTVSNPIYFLDEVYQNFGILLQDNFHFGTAERFEIVAGARADKHSEIKDWVISPRISAKARVNNSLVARASFSTGFKAPQTYDEDLHICGLEGDQRVTRNVADLKPEKSFTLSGGFEFQQTVNNVPVMFAVTGFYTRLNDAFTDRFVSSVDNIDFWERINSDGAKVGGMELDLGVRPLSGLEFRSGWTYKKSQYDSPLEDFNTTNFLRTPDLSGYLRFTYDVSKNLNANASISYSGEMDVPHEIAVEGESEPDLILERSQSFLELNAGIVYELPMIKAFNLKLNLGVKNLTDAYQKDLDYGANRDPAYVYGPQLPRRLYFGLDVSF
jgi:outer membrane receptor for ferrienterochelin and colicins